MSGPDSTKGELSGIDIALAYLGAEPAGFQPADMSRADLIGAALALAAMLTGHLTETLGNDEAVAYLKHRRAVIGLIT